MRSGQIIALDTPSGLKKTAFPETMVEITLAPDRLHSLTNPEEQVLLDRLRVCGNLSEIKPHGMRYHALVGNPGMWADCLGSAGRDFEAKPIQPSLEDVFIRLIEGRPSPKQATDNAGEQSSQ
jgi:hypothetical protein